MGIEINGIMPNKLKGPRSYFTDIDPLDREYNEEKVKLKLKLQLITKSKVVVAASSLFHDIGYKLIANDNGLISALEQGIIVPAVRNTYFSDNNFNIDKFYKDRTDGFSDIAKLFFKRHVKYSVPWDLEENTKFFKSTLYSHLLNDNSLLRNNIGFTSTMAKAFVARLENEIANSGDGFLKREHVENMAIYYDDEVKQYLSNYVNLIYRVSGSKVVNSEGHFPQSNLVKIGVAGNDELLSEEDIFWDIYVEAAISYFNSAMPFTVGQLNKLTIDDILKMRSNLLKVNFINEYDNVISIAKSDIDLSDPEKIILKQEEIFDVVDRLRDEFKNGIAEGLKIKPALVREKGLIQIASVVSKASLPSIGIVFSTVSSFKAIPEITAMINPSLAEDMYSRYHDFRRFINSRIGWSKVEKEALIQGYGKMAKHGLPE